MKREALILWGLILVLAGCQEQQRVFSFGATPPDPSATPSRTLTDQHLVAYPQIGENTYLVIRDFESSKQLANFTLAGSTRLAEGSRVFYSGSPTATGTGALGLSLEAWDDYTLTFATPIRQWKGYNLFLLAVFSEEDQIPCRVSLLDADGKAYHQAVLLELSWNKIAIDLDRAQKSIDMNRVKKVALTFYSAGQTRFFVDDLILVNYRKRLFGYDEGPAGSMFAIQEGRKVRMGANRRFELVFYEGGWIGWYDLSTDRRRINNLLTGDPSEQSDPRALPARGILTRIDDDEILFEIETHSTSLNGSPDRRTTYQIYPDGLILFEIVTRDKDKPSGIDFAVDSEQGFERLTGVVWHRESEAPYIFWQRTGNLSGADLLYVVKPPEHPESLLVRGMIRVWPDEIGRIELTDDYVRDFLETPWPKPIVPAGGADRWEVVWQGHQHP